MGAMTLLVIELIGAIVVMTIIVLGVAVTSRPDREP
jgi:hypothetical protein